MSFYSWNVILDSVIQNGLFHRNKITYGDYASRKPPEGCAYHERKKVGKKS